MNLGNIIRFRTQVEDMIKEELALAEWGKSQEITKHEILQKDLQTISAELERNLPHGIAGAFIEERYRWLEETSQRIERQAHVLGPDRPWRRRACTGCPYDPRPLYSR